MAIIPTGLLILAAAMLTFTLRDVLTDCQQRVLSWHKLCGCNNFYIILNLPDKPMTIIDLLVESRTIESKISIQESKVNYFKIVVPRGASLYELKTAIHLYKTDNSTVKCFFNEINTLFDKKEDQDSYHEIFSYINKALH